jgi:signal transduction histidine kinase
LVNALENERRYVAKELHDGVAQTALQLGLQAGICRKLLERGNLDMLARELVELEAGVQLASTQIRHLIADMRPPQVEPEATLAEYIQHVVNIHRERGGPPVELQLETPASSPDFSPSQKLILARVVQEAMLNIRKHAQAKNVRLTLADEGDQFQLIIADNGQGFDLAEVQTRPVDRGGAGLANLRVRAEAMGGKLTIGRDDNRGWTEVKLTLPKQAA